MAAGSTYTPIATTNGTGSSSSITFSSIPSTYTDLVLIINASTAASTGNPCLRFNGDTGNNYSRTNMGGNGSTAFSDRETSVSRILLIGGVYLDTNLDTNLIVHIQNYANTTTNKTTLARANKAPAGTDANVGLWRSTAAINSVNIFTASGANFSTGSTFTLYGIAAA